MKSIRLQGFKCFVDTRFALGNLTVLSGLNGGGKTSLLHAFCVLQQTLCETNSLEALLLNGPIVNMGRSLDVLNKFSAKSTVSFEIEYKREYITLSYSTEDRQSFIIPRDNICTNDHFEEKLSFFRKVAYISADRSGPSDMHMLEDSFMYEHSVGVRGERAVSILESHSSVDVREELRKPGSPSLPRQVEAYMAEIFGTFKLSILPVKGTNIATLGLANHEGVGFVRPQNIGFGLSYSLPIYVACLSAPEGGIVLIENPEAHLHPKAQSQIGFFLAHVAASGVQVVVETHSDHVLNGIRKAIKRHVLQANDALIYFFSGFDDEGKPKIESPRISANGSLSMWPELFFDQYDKDLEDLIDW